MSLKIEWSENFSLDIPELDEEHKVLIDIINQLTESIKSKQIREHLGEILSRLNEYQNTHHLHETEFMEKINYPQIEEYKQGHYNFQEKIEGLNRLHSMDLLQSKNLLNVLCDWVINHMYFSDREFSEFYNYNKK